MSATSTVSAAEAVERLRAGNSMYVEIRRNHGDVSAERVGMLFEDGQEPYACIIACADSRVVPEHMFGCGLGELFCIRVAGNVIGPMELASALYAAEHLGTKLVLVLGHTHCGAIGSAIADLDGHAEPHDNALTPLVSGIANAIGDERDSYKASVLNVEAGIACLMADPDIAHLAQAAGLEVRGAIYNTDTGIVDFL